MLVSKYTHYKFKGVVSSFSLGNWVYSLENQEKLTPYSVHGRVGHIVKKETTGLELYQMTMSKYFTFKTALSKIISTYGT